MKIRFFFHYILLTGLIIISLYSCTDDGGDNDLKYNSSFFTAFYDTRWISLSDEDSIVMQFDYRHDTIQYKGVYINGYKTINGIKEYKYFRLFDNWGTYQQNKKDILKLSYYNSIESEKDEELQFDLIDDKLTIYDFRDNENTVFYKEYRENKYVNSSVLSGIWHTVLSKDSIVVVFENEMMKEYVYERNTGNILKYLDYDSYRLYQYVYTYRNQRSVEDEIRIYKSNKIERIQKYLLKNNRLIIYNGDNPITYIKID